MSTVLPTKWPDSWEARPAWDVLVSREEFGGEGDQLSLSVVHGIRFRDASEGRAASDDTDHYRVVRRGDLVINRLVARDGAVHVSPLDGLISPAYWVMKTRRSSDDVRFIAYQLRSAVYLAEIARVSKDMPPAQFDLPWDQFRKMSIVLPRPDKQRAIADYLDTETARIDALIEKKERLSGVLESRLASEVESTITDHSAPLVALGRFVLDLGQGSSPQAGSRPAEADEWGVLKLSAVKAGRLVPAENKTLGPGWAGDPSLVPGVGELLITRANTPDLVGDVCAVREPVRNLMVSDLIYKLRLDDRLLASYAAYALRTSEARFQLSSAARGSSQSMVKLRGEDLRGVRLPVPSPERQTDVVASLDVAAEATSASRARLARQLELLREHRQALITATVTGQLEVPGVAA